MIKMKNPSLAVNSNDVPGPDYRMWETVDADRGMTADDLVGEIVRVNRLALEYYRTPLQNIVINCHGLDGGGGLAIGGQGKELLTVRNASAFSVLKGKNLGTIWLVACQAARNSAGKTLCQAIASASGSQVVAGEDDQEVGRWGAFRIRNSGFAGFGGGRGLIDEYEGKVFSFTPAGGAREIDPHDDIYTILE
jgi:hypothetical protein